MSDVERTEFQLPERDVVDTRLQAGEQDAETTLRPRSLDEFIGQQKVRSQLSLVLTGAKNRGVTPDHVLLSGPPGICCYQNDAIGTAGTVYGGCRSIFQYVNAFDISGVYVTDGSGERNTVNNYQRVVTGIQRA